MSAPTSPTKLLCVPVVALLERDGLDQQDLRELMAQCGYVATGSGTINNLLWGRRRSVKGRRAMALALGIKPGALMLMTPVTAEDGEAA